MASEVKSITSEALEAAYRALTPSQSGFTQDLQASNTIIPILDLTANAEGTSTPTQLQEALGFDDITSTTTTGAAGSDTIINNTGFWLIEYQVICSNAQATPFLYMSNGLSNKNLVVLDTGSAGPIVAYGRLTVFLTAGDSVVQTTNNVDSNVHTVVRQIADINGNLVNPTGFTPQ